MARDISCDFCQSEPAFGIWSEVADGTTVAVGKDCVPSFLGGLAQAFGLLSEQPAAGEGKPDGQDSGTGEGDGVAEVSEGKPRPRRSRKPRGEPSTVDEPAESIVDDPPVCAVCGAVYPEDHNHQRHVEFADQVEA